MVFKGREVGNPRKFILDFFSIMWGVGVISAGNLHSESNGKTLRLIGPPGEEI